MTIQTKNYATGTYLFFSKKEWVCESCKQPILTKTGGKVFTRIECYGPILKNQQGEDYQHKNYTRYHCECAITLKDLTAEEIKLIQSEIRRLQDEVHSYHGKVEHYLKNK